MDTVPSSDAGLAQDGACLPQEAGCTPAHTAQPAESALQAGTAPDSHALTQLPDVAGMDPATMLRTLANINSPLLPADAPGRAKNYLLCLHTVITACPQKEALPMVKMLVEEAGVDIRQLVCLESHFGLTAPGSAAAGARHGSPGTAAHLHAHAAELPHVSDAVWEDAPLDDVALEDLLAGSRPQTGGPGPASAAARAMVPTRGAAPRLGPSGRGNSTLGSYKHAAADSIRTPSGKSIPATTTNLALMDKLNRSEAKAATVASKGIAMDAVTAAASVGAGAVLLYLVSRGARVNTRDSVGGTPLHHAVIGGHADVVQLLVKVGADLNAPDNESLTPLHSATSAHMPDIVALLLKLGANVNATEDITGLTPMHTATDAATLRALLRAAEWREQGRREGLLAPVETTGPAGASTSHAESTALAPRKPAVRAAIAPEIEATYAPQVNKRSVRGWSPLYAVAYIGYPSCVRLLLDYGADPAALTDTGETPLHAACRSNVVSVVDMLIQAGSDLDVVSHGGLTPFHVAAHLPDPAEICSLLYRCGARSCCMSLSPPRKCAKCRVAMRRVQVAVPALSDGFAEPGEQPVTSAEQDSGVMDDAELEAMLGSEPFAADRPSNSTNKSRREARKERKRRAKAAVGNGRDPGPAAEPGIERSKSEQASEITVAASTMPDAPPSFATSAGGTRSTSSTDGDDTSPKDSDATTVERVALDARPDEDDEGEEWTDFATAVAAMSREMSARASSAPSAVVQDTAPRRPHSLGQSHSDCSATGVVANGAPPRAQHASEAAPSASSQNPHTTSWSHPYFGRSFGQAPSGPVPESLPRFATLGTPPVATGMSSASITSLGGSLGIGLGSGLGAASVMAVAGLGLASRMVNRAPSSPNAAAAGPASSARATGQ